MKPIYRHINGKTYRYGYTTGTCAAAAAKAATLLLCSGETPKKVHLITPSGMELDLDVQNATLLPDGSALCGVVKDSGDDPDVTNGLTVQARVWRNTENCLLVTAGEGVGMVTRKGLQIDIGQPAINPAPMRMIIAEVEAIAGVNAGVTVEISIPGGTEVAKKTFNERLGVVGGLSILGTSGLVIPMSDEAFKESLALELSMLKEKGVTEVVLTPGNYGENFVAANYPEWTDHTVTTSNFIGYMLHQAVFYGMQKVWLVGHIGKLVKVAGGIFHTHSSVADARVEVLAAHYMLHTGDEHGFRNIMHSNTTDEAMQYIKDKAFFDILCKTIKTRCEQHVHHKLTVEVVLFSLEMGLLGRTEEPSIQPKQ